MKAELEINIEGKRRVCVIEYCIRGKYRSATRFQPEELPELEIEGIRSIFLMDKKSVTPTAHLEKFIMGYSDSVIDELWDLAEEKEHEDNV